MPVKFHTKTLESVIDPVSQQVGNLVLIHENAASGPVVEDLTVPVKGVVGAVSNLGQIAKDMASSTTDQLLKAEMPAYVQEVEDAGQMLMEAATDLKADQMSEPGKAKLLSGARGIISGMSDLLVCADMAEIRKMVAKCRRVLEYLTDVAKVVNQEADLVTFVQNLTPQLTSMVKVVEGRWPELTNEGHATILKTELTSVKQQTPVLISAIRAYASISQRQGPALKHAATGRDYVVGKMVTSIEEIIRVLQLTTTKEDDPKKAGQSMDAYLRGMAEVFHQAQEALASGDMSPSTIDSVRKCIAEGRRVAAHAAKAETRAKLEEICRDLDQILLEIAALEAAGKGDTRAARLLAHRAAVKLQELEQEIRRAIAEKVATDFVDVTGPIKALEAAATADVNDPDRQAKFEQRAKEFDLHRGKLEDTALMVANSGGCDPVTAEEIQKAVAKMKDLSPQVLAAARVVLENPNNKPALEHFTTMKKEWVDNASELTRLVDSATDSLEFLKVSEANVKADVEHAKDLVRREQDPAKVVTTAGNVGRQANRVLQFAQQEAQNSDDQAYVNSLTTASDKLSKSIGPMLIEAKSVVSNPKNKAQQEKFCNAADQVAEHVSAVRAVVEDNWVPPRPPLPEFTEEEEAPPLPPPPPEILEPVPDDMLEAEQILRGPVVDKNENPVTFAAMGAFHEADKWEEKDNHLVSLAKQMARKMAMMSKYMSGEASDVHSKADLIKCAKEIAASAQEMLKLARQIANDCTDKRLKANLMQRIDKIPTISTQLKILANVKATTMGGDEKADQDASEMLVGNAENLMGTVKDVIRAAEAACIRLRPGSAVASVIWRRKGGQARRLSLQF